MKIFTIIYLCLATTFVSAQNNETSRTITNNTVLSYFLVPDMSITPQYTYVDNFDQFIALPEQTNIENFQSNMIYPTDFTGNWMGTSTSQKFQFMNREVESIQIYDLNGVLRQSSWSISISKKKK